MSINIVYEDDYIVCVSKPNNVLVHHANYAKNVSNETSLVEILFKEVGKKLLPIHRLDRKTSGIILFAKNTKYVSDFQQLFLTNNIEKIYYGLVRGYSPQNLSINSPVKGRDSNVYRDAMTILETINTIELDIPVKPYQTSRYSLVKLIPKTGRLHQLRIHLNKISHPLISDPKYGDNNHNIMFQKEFNNTNLFLHAYSIRFIHPFTNQLISLESPLPKHWTDFFQKTNWNLKRL